MWPPGFPDRAQGVAGAGRQGLQDSEELIAQGFRPLSLRNSVVRGGFHN